MDVLKGLKADGFGASQLDRDEFGMPCASNVSEDKVENVLHQSTPVAPQVFADTPKKATPDPFVDKLKGKLGDEVKGSSVPTPVVQGCHSLGHSIAACPSVTRVWQRKNIGISEETKATIDPTSSNIPTQKDSGGSSTVKPLGVEQNEEWTEVKRKNSGSISDCDSPSPTNMFKNLKKVDEIDNKHGVPVHASKRLTKSQKKKLKASLGTGSPSQS
ncbi:hypothetical protein ACET3Z_018277 [Daucus carota]